MPHCMCMYIYIYSTPYYRADIGSKMAVNNSPCLRIRKKIALNFAGRCASTRSSIVRASFSDWKVVSSICVLDIF